MLKARGKKRTYSTQVVGAIRQLNRLEFVIETTRYALKARYATRSGVECVFSQASRRCDIQQARYRSLKKTQVQQLLTAMVINLLRWNAWSQERPIAHICHARFAALSAA